MIVAHRLGAVCNVDWLIVLDNGEIIESGTHAELLALGGAYATPFQKSQNLAPDERRLPRPRLI